MNQMSNIYDAYKDFSTERFPNIVESDIVSFEERVRIRLPSDYRQFLVNFNGGYFSEPQIVHGNNEVPIDRLTFMHGIRSIHPEAELGKEEDIAMFDDNNPPEIIPVGCTIMGNLVLLVTHPDPEENGSVILKTIESTFYLARGIVHFFALLQKPRYD